jgi:hypothetical protein
MPDDNQAIYDRFRKSRERCLQRQAIVGKYVEHVVQSLVDQAIAYIDSQDYPQHVDLPASVALLPRFDSDGLVNAQATLNSAYAISLIEKRLDAISKNLPFNVSFQYTTVNQGTWMISIF